MLISLPTKHYEALQALKEALSEFCDRYEQVRVFGSCVKGQATATSDVDILIITKEQLTDRVKREILCEYISEVTERFGVEADVVFYSEEDYKMMIALSARGCVKKAKA